MSDINEGIKMKSFYLFFFLSSFLGIFQESNYNFYILREKNFVLYDEYLDKLKISNSFYENDGILDGEEYSFFAYSGKNMNIPSEEDKISYTLPLNAESVEVSAYTRSVKEGTIRGITSSGDMVQEGYIAGSRDLVKKYGYGTIFNLYGKDRSGNFYHYGRYVLKDKMHPRYKNTIDIYMEKYSDAMDFGRRKMFFVVE